MARAAPAVLSTATKGSGASGASVPQPTATSGTRSGMPTSAATAEVCGAITMMPSTAWPTNRSTASSTPRWSSAGRLAMLTKYACRAACSIPYSIEAGPYSVVSKLITPSVWVRRVTSVRAAAFGR